MMLWEMATAMMRLTVWDAVMTVETVVQDLTLKPNIVLSVNVFMEKEKVFSIYVAQDTRIYFIEPLY